MDNVKSRREEVRRLLTEAYTSDFQLHSSEASVKRAADLPAADADGHIAGFGTFFGLGGFDAVVQQVYRRLLRLHICFADHDDFLRGLQLLRLVSAPGMGKSTVLQEVWAKLYQLAYAHPDDGTPTASLKCRILPSLKPGAEMVFLMDLMSPDLSVLDPLEVRLGAHTGCVLALRMLYSSLSRSSHSTYSSFLHEMGPQLRCFIEPLDVLYFWRQAAGIEEGTPWMAVFAVDEVGAASPGATLQEPSWLQTVLASFAWLRKEAASHEGQHELLFMPLVITASSRASASSLQVTARHSRTKDIHLRPLTDLQMQAVIVGLAKRSRHSPEIPPTLPPQLVLLLQLIGGNPRLLSQTLCLLAGSRAVHNEEFLAGHADCWRWLQGDFNLIKVVDQLCKVSLKDIWGSCRAADSVQITLLNQLVAHCVCRVPIARQDLVPGSQAAGTPTSWQDLEEAGLAYIVPPGEFGIQGASWSAYALQMQASGENAEPGNECDATGWLDPDAAPQLITTPPLLLVAALRLMAPSNNRLAWVPLLRQFTDEWRQPELTGVSILVARLRFWHDVLHQPQVLLSDLLGGIDVGGHEKYLCVPDGHFSVWETSSHEDPMVPAQLANMVSNIATQWAYQGPGNPGPNAWLLLQCDSGTKQSDSGRSVLLSFLSKKNEAEACIQVGKLQQQSGQILHIPGEYSLLVYATDQRRPLRSAAVAQSVDPESTVSLDRKSLPAYYRACIALLNTRVPLVGPDFAQGLAVVTSSFQR